jgi:hypothetical protein
VVKANKPSMDDIILYPSKIKTFLVAIGALMFVLLGFFLSSLANSGYYPSWFMYAVAFSSISFFGLCFVYAVSRLLFPRPSVIISRDGIFDNASALGAGMLKWEEIAEIAPYKIGGYPALVIFPVDEEAVIARQSLIKRLILKISKCWTEATFSIPQIGLTVSVDELLRMIEERRR